MGIGGGDREQGDEKGKDSLLRAKAAPVSLRSSMQWQRKLRMGSPG